MPCSFTGSSRDKSISVPFQAFRNDLFSLAFGSSFHIQRQQYCTPLSLVFHISHYPLLFNSSNLGGPCDYIEFIGLIYFTIIWFQQLISSNSNYNAPLYGTLQPQLPLTMQPNALTGYSEFILPSISTTFIPPPMFTTNPSG